MAFDAGTLVNETTLNRAREALGLGVRFARKSKGLTQQRLATATGIDLATVQGLEHGRGTVAPLVAVLAILEHRFAGQPGNIGLGAWLTDIRKLAGYSQAAAALLIGVSKPTVIQIERERGNLRGLLGMMSALGLPIAVAPACDLLNGTRLIHGDCMQVMPSLASGSIDLVVTSPPYNLANYNGSKPHFTNAVGRGTWHDAAIAKGYASHSDDLPWPEYVEWQRRFISECWRLIPEHGAIFYNHKPRSVQKALVTPMELIPDGVILRQIVIWDRGGGHNFNPAFFIPSHEWVMIFAKPGFRLNSGGRPRDVWTIPPVRSEKGDARHPAPFPVELAAKAIRSTSAKVVLDPFAGSGSTGVAAIQEGRRFVGIEKDAGYVEMARERLRRAVSGHQRASVDH